MDSIKKKLQGSLDESGDRYKLKTNKKLVSKIILFGCGKTKFHTADIERLIKENEFLKKEVKQLKNNPK